MASSAHLNSLIERVADAPGPERQLFVDVWLACAGKQPSDINAPFAIPLGAKAWTDAAVVIVACALPGWHVATRCRPRKAGKAQLLEPAGRESQLRP